jgi:hypothetical protein
MRHPGALDVRYTVKPSRLRCTRARIHARQTTWLAARRPNAVHGDDPVHGKKWLPVFVG